MIVNYMDLNIIHNFSRLQELWSMDGILMYRRKHISTHGTNTLLCYFIWKWQKLLDLNMISTRGMEAFNSEVSKILVLFELAFSQISSCDQTIGAPLRFLST